MCEEIPNPACDGRAAVYVIYVMNLLKWDILLVMFQSANCSQNWGILCNQIRNRMRGSNSPDRDAQFKHIYDCTNAFFSEEQPVISVDAKKKELIGNFKNNGREFQLKGQGTEVEVYDFINENGRATPYGIYDIATQ